MRRPFLALLLLLALPSCGGRVVVDHCQPVTLRAYEGAPIAAVGPAVADGLPVPLSARLAPTEEGVELHAIRWGVAPGWGCTVPPSARVQVGTWTGTVALEPAGDLGGGFALVEGVLPEAVRVPAGEPIDLAVELAATVECGAKTVGPVGASWRGVEELDGALVIEAEGCAGQGQE